MINDEASSVEAGMLQLEERLNLHMAQSKKLIQPGDELNENWWQVRHKYPHKSPNCRNPHMTCTHGSWNTTDLFV